MHVVDIDGFDIEIAQTAIELVEQIFRRYAVAAADDIGGAGEAGLDKSVLDVLARFLGRRAVIGYEAAFGGDDDLVAVETLAAEFFERRADGAFAALEAVVDGAVEDVAAGADRRDDGLVILLIGGVVIVPQVGAEANGRQPKILGLAKMLARKLVGESLAVTVGAGE